MLTDSFESCEGSIGSGANSAFMHPHETSTFWMAMGLSPRFFMPMSKRTFFILALSTVPKSYRWVSHCKDVVVVSVAFSPLSITVCGGLVWLHPGNMVLVRPVR